MEVETWSRLEELIGQSDIGEDGDDMVDAVDAKFHRDGKCL